MSDEPTGVSVTPLDILHIIEGRARQIAVYAQQPPQNFDAEALRRAIAQLYGYADELVTMMDKAKAANPQAEAN